MKRFEYFKPKSLKEAIDLKLKHGSKAMFIAGGTDVIVGIKNKRFTPEILISLNGIRDFAYIKEEEMLRIGALTTHSELEESRLIRERFGALKDGVESLGSVQIRNVGTIGGNICNAAPSADLAPPLLVHNAILVVEGSKGKREIPIEEFFIGPGKTALEQDEVLTEFLIPFPEERANSAYWKYGRREAMDLPIVSMAMYLNVEIKDVKPLERVIDDLSIPLKEQLRALDESIVLCREMRVAVGLAGPTPFRMKEIENMVTGERLTGDLLIEIGYQASKSAKPRDTWRAEAWYRKEIIKVMPKRLSLTCLRRILGGKDGKKNPF